MICVFRKKMLPSPDVCVKMRKPAKVLNNRNRTKRGTNLEFKNTSCCDQTVKEVNHVDETVHFKGRSFSLNQTGRPNPKKGRL